MSDLSVSGKTEKFVPVGVYSASPASYSTASLAVISLLIASFTMMPASASPSAPSLTGGGSLGTGSQRIEMCVPEYCGAGEFLVDETEDDCASDDDGEGAHAIVCQIQNVALSQLREPDEQPPNGDVCQSLAALLNKTEEIYGLLPSADVSAFYGELSVTWRNGDRMVSVFVDSDGVSVHHGSLTQDGVGGYISEALDGPRSLAVKLKELQTPALQRAVAE